MKAFLILTILFTLQQTNALWVTWQTRSDMIESGGIFSVPFSSQAWQSEKSFDLDDTQYEISHNLKHIKIRPNSETILDSISHCINSNGILTWGVDLPRIANISLIINHNGVESIINSIDTMQWNDKIDIQKGCYDIRMIAISNSFSCSCPMIRKFPRFIVIYGIMNTNMVTNIDTNMITNTDTNMVMNTDMNMVRNTDMDMDMDMVMNMNMNMVMNIFIDNMNIKQIANTVINLNNQLTTQSNSTNNNYSTIEPIVKLTTQSNSTNNNIYSLVNIIIVSRIINYEI